MKGEQVNQIRAGVTNELKKTLKDHLAKLKIDILTDFKEHISRELEEIFESEVIPFCEDIIRESFVESGYRSKSKPRYAQPVA
jgi:hypothetical protein